MNEKAASCLFGKLLFCSINSFQKYQFYGMMKEMAKQRGDYGVQLVEKGELKFVGIRLQCDSLEEYQVKIPETVGELKARISEIAQPIDQQRIFGLFKVEAEPFEDGYWVCLQVEEIENVVADLEGLLIEPSKYATLRHVGSPKELHQAYANLHEEIAQQGHQRILDQWTIEEYSPDQEQSRQTINVLLHDPVA